MDQFFRWSGIAHSLLSQHFPKIKLGQVHQLLAAWLGHQTYASLRVADLATLNQKPRYFICDYDDPLVRAAKLGLPLTATQWREVVVELSPSGITPFWLTSVAGMDMAARLVFEESFDVRISSIKHANGEPNGHWATSSRCHTAEDQLPDILRFDVDGDVCAINPEASLAIPVRVVVEFSKIGERMYGEGLVVSVALQGPARTRDPDEEEENLGDAYWNTDY